MLIKVEMPTIVGISLEKVEKSMLKHKILNFFFFFENKTDFFFLIPNVFSPLGYLAGIMV